MSQRKEWFGSVSIKSVTLLLLLCSGLAQAALPPKEQNEKDLDLMLSYVKSHPAVLSSLQAIDLGILTIYYGEGCSAEFGRKIVQRPEGWVGPAEPLVLKRNFCPDETTTASLDAGMDDLAGSDSLGGITSRVTDSCGAEIVQVKDEGCKITTE